MKVIETTGQLNDFCTSLAKQEFITVDLEFHREKTYYAKLGLIQVACPGDELSSTRWRQTSAWMFFSAFFKTRPSLKFSTPAGRTLRSFTS